MCHTYMNNEQLIAAYWRVMEVDFGVKSLGNLAI